jgi:hypothetical protein
MAAVNAAYERRDGRRLALLVKAGRKWQERS